MRFHPAARQVGFTLIEVLVVITIIGILVAVLGVAVTGIRLRAQEEKTISMLRRLETGVQAYVTRYNLVPPVNTPPAALGVANAAVGAGGGPTDNYRASGALHYYLGSNLFTFSGWDAGGPKIKKKQTPIVEFKRSEIATWNALAAFPVGAYSLGQPGGDLVANGAGPQAGVILDSWQRAIAYVPSGADHSTALLQRPGSSFNKPGRNLTGFCQMWSRGIDMASSLPSTGAVGPGVTGDLDDIVLWFLPYY